MYKLLIKKEFKELLSNLVIRNNFGNTKSLKQNRRSSAVIDNVYNKWFSNFIKQNTNYRMSGDLLETLQNYMNKCDYYNFMDNSFEWEDTDEGYFFWKGVADSIKRK